MTANPIVVVENISKTFRSAQGRGEHRALDNVSLTIEPGQVLVIIGPSGSGKSTLLRTMNALERFDTGRIIVDGVSLGEKGTDLNRMRAEIGMVFQHFTCFSTRPRWTMWCSRRPWCARDRATKPLSAPG